MIKMILIFSGLLFTFGAGLHLYRLFFPFQVIIGNFHLSRWGSLFFVLLGFFLAYLLFYVAFSTKQCF